MNIGAGAIPLCVCVRACVRVCMCVRGCINVQNKCPIEKNHLISMHAGVVH